MSGLAAVEARLGAEGLVSRGAFHPLPEDAVPPLANGRLPGTLVLAGNAGPAMWRAFGDAPERHLARDPLDAWSARVLGAVAAALGGAAVFPFGGPPFHPFQRWARRAQAVVPSPLGLLVHPTYGLWHAYRGALLLAQRLTLPPVPADPAPCATCPDTPCLTTCPVSAFDGQGYDVDVCVTHSSGPDGAACLDGCLARRACPAGAAYAYEPDQARFHVRAFLNARARASRRNAPADSRPPGGTRAQTLHRPGIGANRETP